MRARLGVVVNVGLLVAGAALVVWALAAGPTPVVSCRGVPMRAGDVCRHADVNGSPSPKVQTYEQRVAAWRQSRPVVLATGVALAILAGVLLSGPGNRTEESK